MAGETGGTYSATTNKLASYISSALLGLNNASAKVLTLADLGLDINLPSAPSNQVTVGDAPADPASVDIPNVTPPATPAIATNVAFPSAPAAASSGSWSKPSRPSRPYKFESFFVGTPDTPEELVERANAEVAQWVETYFPAINNCFKNEPEDWICDVISGVRPLGNSEQAIDIAWRAAKSNEFKQLMAERQTVAEEFRGRGFTMPPGAMAAALRRSQERFSDATAAVNREAALKDIDVQARLLELAVSVASDLKRGMASVMADYYRTIVAVQDKLSETNNERARIMADAEARFIAEMNTYEQINQSYNEAVNGLRLETSRVNTGIFDVASRNASSLGDFQLRTAEANLRAAETELQARVEAARAAATKAQAESTVYRSKVDAYQVKVNADVAVAQFEVDKYRAQVEAAVAKARASAGSGAGTGLAGIAQGFGAIGQAAANAQGSLVAQIEGF